MNKLLEGLEGVVCLMDDVLDTRLTKVLERIKSAGVVN